MFNNINPVDFEFRGEILKIALIIKMTVWFKVESFVIFGNLGKIKSRSNMRLKWNFHHRKKYLVPSIAQIFIGRAGQARFKYSENSNYEFLFENTYFMENHIFSISKKSSNNIQTKV